MKGDITKVQAFLGQGVNVNAINRSAFHAQLPMPPLAASSSATVMPSDHKESRDSNSIESVAADQASLFSLGSERSFGSA